MRIKLKIKEPAKGVINLAPALPAALLTESIDRLDTVQRIDNFAGHILDLAIEHESVSLWDSAGVLSVFHPQDGRLFEQQNKDALFCGQYTPDIGGGDLVVDIKFQINTWQEKQLQLQAQQRAPSWQMI